MQSIAAECGRKWGIKMAILRNAQCDHCGKVKKVISAGSIYTTGFCKECLELVIEDCENAIEEINDALEEEK